MGIEATVKDPMSQHPVALRAANPTFEDGHACARYADVASEGFMRVMFGRRFEDIIATAFIQPDHDLSYQNVIFAERDDAIVGMTLMDDFEEQARASGSTRLSLDVSTKNEVARRFYEERGWVVEWGWPKLWFMPSLSVRMTKPL
jgi:GNAT superfamily N-acetyltransferase